ncbi:MAG: DUF6512 family protein [Bacilli bacterium]|jgi:hypothetical protein
MNQKKTTIIGIFFIFFLSFITHNLYTWIPSFVTSIFFPVNESLFEHQKMIFITTILWGIMENIILNKKEIPHYNINTSILLSALSNIIIFLIIYIPIYIAFGHNLIVTLVIYFISIVISQIIGYMVLKHHHKYPLLNKIALLLIIVIIICFGVLTYYPIKEEFFFYDKANQKYGIYNYYDNRKQD